MNLLASETSETPMNARPRTAPDEHTSLEAGASPTKEGYTPPYSVPWYRQGKWRITMLVAVIIVIGAIVGGVVGGVVGSKNRTSTSTASRPPTVVLPTETPTESSTTVNTSTNLVPLTSPPSAVSPSAVAPTPNQGTGINVGGPNPTQGSTR